MSALAGIYARRGGPIDPAVLARISRGLSDAGPDDERVASVGSVRMLFRPFETEPRARRGTQPVVTADGDALTFDGRLDNAGDLRRRLGDLARECRSDAELVLTAYRAWGPQGFVHFVGDFALALWDAARACLVLCCDALGRRPLYYHCTPDYVFWSTRCRPLLPALGLASTPDDEFVVDFLLNRASVRSPFKDIEPLRGGHLLVVDAERVDLKCYWRFNPTQLIRYQKDDDYEHHFAELFQAAVACRIDVEGPVFCELSGGIDSSSIACVADHLVKRQAVGAESIRTISYIFPESASADETSYRTQVECALGIEGFHISDTQYPLLSPLPPSFAPDGPTHSLSCVSRVDRAVTEMRRYGSRVLLSGVGGDHLFWSQPDVTVILADDLVRREPLTFLRHATAWSRLLKTSRLRLAGGAVRHLLPRRWHAVEAPPGDWFAPAFARRTDLRARMLPMADDLGFGLPSRAAQYAGIREAMRTLALEVCCSAGYVDCRYPFLDRRLAEFSLAIPMNQKVRLGESRSIVRRGLKGLVPDGVLQRRTKSTPAEAFHRSLARRWTQLSPLLDDPLVAAYGFVDRAAFATALRQARHGQVVQQSQLARTISLELWLRTLDTPIH